LFWTDEARLLLVGSRLTEVRSLATAAADVTEQLAKLNQGGHFALTSC